MKHTPIHNLGANYMTLWSPFMDTLAYKCFEWKMDGCGWTFLIIEEKEIMMDEFHACLCCQWSSHIILILK
jgi:hypothetical protein